MLHAGFADVPDMHNSTLAALQLVPFATSIKDTDTIHIYTDGTYLHAKNDNDDKIAWSFTVVPEHANGMFSVLGFAAANVTTTAGASGCVGIAEHSSINAAYAAVIYALLWVLQGGLRNPINI